MRAVSPQQSSRRGEERPGRHGVPVTHIETLKRERGNSSDDGDYIIQGFSSQKFPISQKDKFIPANSQERIAFMAGVNMVAAWVEENLPGMTLYERPQWLDKLNEWYE